MMSLDLDNLLVILFIRFVSLLHACVPAIHNIVSVETLTETLLFLFFYHIVFMMFVWSYWQTVFTAIGRVPSKVSAILPFFLLILVRMTSRHFT